MATRSRTDSGVVGGLEAANLVVVGSGVLTIVAVFLPWMTFSAFGQTGSSNGLDMMDGSILFSGAVTAVLALVVVGLAVAASDNENARVAEAILGVLVAGIGAMYFLAPDVAMGGGLGGRFAAALADPAIGVIVTIVGGIGMIAGGLIGYSG